MMTINFDNVARNWDDDPIHIKRAKKVSEAIINLVPISKKMRALEFGAGTGQLSFYLQARFSEIILVDNSQGMLDVLSEKIATAKLSHLHPIKFDINNQYQFQQLGQFEVIYMMMALHHILNIEYFLKTINMLLNPNGILFICDLDSEDGSFHEGATDVIYGFDRDKLGQLILNAGFVDPQYQTILTINKNGRDYPVFFMHTHK